ncbi:MFS transporter [Streptomyces sp. NPDC052109]|uniref:MFS transporter n=1 Tax=Streptomyces sp. NPDC052109 TaxID=3155527 RepID=UPI003418C869
MTAQHVPLARREDSSAQVTPIRRFVPAMLLTQLGFYAALTTPLQLLLVLRLDSIAGPGARSALGVVTGFGALCAVVATPIGGRLSDRTRARFGRRRTWIFTGSLVFALALAAMTVTTAVWQVVLLWCLAQAAGNFQFAANVAIMADQVAPDKRGLVSGLVGLVAAIGPIAGIAAANAFPAGAAAQWLALAVGSFGTTLVAVLLFRDPPGTEPKPPLNLRTLAGTFWFNPYRYPAFGWAWLVRFLIMCTYSASGYTAFFLMQHLDVSKARVGTVTLEIGLVGVVCLGISSALAGYASDALGKQRPFVVFSGIAAAAALVLMSTAASVTTVLAASGLLGFAVGTFLAVDLALCMRVLPRAEDTAKDLAIINIAVALPQSLVPFAAPALIALGGYPALYLTLAALGLLGAAAILRVPEVGREHTPGRAAPITRI